MREGSRRSTRSMRSSEGTLGDAPEEEEESWSSDYSASDEEEDQETFSESTEVSAGCLVGVGCHVLFRLLWKGHSFTHSLYLTLNYVLYLKVQLRMSVFGSLNFCNNHSI